MKNILIAIDYDPSAQIVAELGYTLAKSMNAKVTLLHVMADSTYYSTINYVPIMDYTGFVNINFLDPDIMESLEKQIHIFLDKTKNHLNDSSIETLVIHGDASSTIIETAQKLHSAIIVMGTHSRRGMEEILLGSVAHKVLKHSGIPMYIIPTRK